MPTAGTGRWWPWSDGAAAASGLAAARPPSVTQCVRSCHALSLIMSILEKLDIFAVCRMRHRSTVVFLIFFMLLMTVLPSTHPIVEGERGLPLGPPPHRGHVSVHQ